MTLPDLRPLVRLDARLREVPVDRPAVEAALEAASRALEASEKAGEEAGDRQRLLAYAGNAARILGRSEDSIAFLQQALAAAAGDGTVAARIRLGEAYRCADRPQEAVDELEAALAGARGTTAYLDFALQHLGKALIDAGRPGEAVALLEEALVLRREHGDAELLESTELALAHARALS